MPSEITFSEAQREALVRLRKAGRSWERIGEEFGVSKGRAHAEGVSLGLAAPLPVRVRSVEDRGNLGPGGVLWAWHPIARNVLAEAGLPVPAVGEVW